MSNHAAYGTRAEAGMERKLEAPPGRSVVALTLVRGAASATSARGLQAVCDYLTQHLDEPDLRPSHAAAALGISVRQLHRLFQAIGVSMGVWVRRERLARCAADMRDRSLSALSITDIAYRWGFNDSAHFSRCFKTQYAMPPRRYRAKHGMRPATVRRQA